MEGILHCRVPHFKENTQGFYIAKYTGEADLIRQKKFSQLPVFCEIFFKILFASAALFVLDWRLALITLFLLTTPLYVPKLIEKRIQNAQSAYVKASGKILQDCTTGLRDLRRLKIFPLRNRFWKNFMIPMTEQWIVCWKICRSGKLHG